MTKRKLDKKYTLEIPQAAEHTFGDEVFQEMEEMVKEALGKVQPNWHQVRAPVYFIHVGDEWCKNNIQGDFAYLGTRWFFEKEQDAIWFRLKWT
jgi:hypothetical protein